MQHRIAAPVILSADKIAVDAYIQCGISTIQTCHFLRSQQVVNFIRFFRHLPQASFAVHRFRTAEKQISIVNIL